MFRFLLLLFDTYHVCVFHGEFLICLRIFSPLCAPCSNWTPGKVTCSCVTSRYSSITRVKRLDALGCFLYVLQWMWSRCMEISKIQKKKMVIKQHGKMNSALELTAGSLYGSCSSSEKLGTEQQDPCWLFWALLTWLSVFSTQIKSSQLEPLWPTCLQSPPWFFSSFLQVLHMELIWAVVTCALSGERMRLAHALPPAAKPSACLTIGLAKCELMGPLSHHEGKKTEILLEIKCTKKKKSTEKFRRNLDRCSLLYRYGQVQDERTLWFSFKTASQILISIYF